MNTLDVIAVSRHTVDELERFMTASDPNIRYDIVRTALASMRTLEGKQSQESAQTEALQTVEAIRHRYEAMSLETDDKTKKDYSDEGELIGSMVGAGVGASMGGPAGAIVGAGFGNMIGGAIGGQISRGSGGSGGSIFDDGRLWDQK